MKRSMLPLLCLLFALPAADLWAQETAKDAYIEAWFLETAEGNLEQALVLYRRCIELGANEDRELVARAAWRIGRIARARGDVEAARLQFERVVASYSATRAAKFAAQELEQPERLSDLGKETEAVEEARRLLLEMLGNSAAATTPRARMVFRTLSLDQVLRLQENHGGSLFSLAGKLGPADFQDLLVELVIQAPPVDVDVAALRSLASSPDFSIPDRLRRRLPDVSKAARRPALNLLQTREDPGALLILSELISSDPAYQELVDLNFMKWLLTDDRAEARDLLDCVLDMQLRELSPEGMSGRIPWREVYLNSPGARRLRERVPELPAQVRLGVAQTARQMLASVPRDLLDRLAEDMEPLVRREAIQALLVSAGPDQRREGIERFLAEPGPIPLETIRHFIISNVEFVPLEELMLFPRGDLLEYVYVNLLNDPRRNPAEVIRFALERGHTEVVSALLLPRYWQNPRFSRTTTVQPRDHINVHRLRTGFESAQDPEIALRLARVVAKSENEQLRLTFLDDIARVAQQDRAFAGVPDLFARDPSARIRLYVLEKFPFSALEPETREAVLLDPDLRVAGEALMRCDDPQAIVTVVNLIDGLAGYANRAIQLKSPEAVRAVYLLLPAEDPWAVQCLEYLAEADVGIVLKALDRGGGVPNRLNQAAVEILKRLQLPEPLRERFSSMQLSEDWFRGTAERFRERHEEVEAAFRTYRINSIVTYVRVRGGSEPVLREQGRRLAELGARDELIGLVRSGSTQWIMAGAFGLGALGLRDELLEALRTTTQPEALIGPALEAGLAPDLRDLADVGRLTLDVVVRQAGERGLSRVVADLMCPRGETPRRVSLPSASLRSCLTMAIDQLAADRDADRLALAVRLYDEPAAVRALFQIEAYERILADMSSWQSVPLSEAFNEMHRRTGLPETEGGGRPPWPTFQAEQQELISRWRQALGL